MRKTKEEQRQQRIARQCGHKGKFEWVPIASIIRDARYQRGEETRWLEIALEEGLDWERFGVAKLYDLGAATNGKQYEAYDAKQRILLAHLSDCKYVPAMIFSAPAYLERAETTLKAQQQRAWNCWFKFRNRVEAKDPTALAVLNTLREYGYAGNDLGDSCKWQPIAKLWECGKRYPTCVRSVVRICHSIYSGQSPYVRIVEGVVVLAVLLRKKQQLVDDMMLQRFQQLGAERLRKSVEQAFMRSGRRGPALAAFAMAHIYNKRLQKKNRLPVPEVDLD